MTLCSSGMLSVQLYGMSVVALLSPVATVRASLYHTFFFQQFIAEFRNFENQDIPQKIAELFVPQ